MDLSIQWYCGSMSIRFETKEEEGETVTRMQKCFCTKGMLGDMVGVYENLNVFKVPLWDVESMKYLFIANKCNNISELQSQTWSALLQGIPDVLVVQNVRGCTYESQAEFFNERLSFGSNLLIPPSVVGGYGTWFAWRESKVKVEVSRGAGGAIIATITRKYYRNWVMELAMSLGV